MSLPHPRILLLTRLSLLALVVATPHLVLAKVVVFSQPGFPTVGSEPVSREVISAALRDLHPEFADEATLQAPATLDGAELLVLPYGSAVPVASWGVIEKYLHQGGNLLILGGQPFEVPVLKVDGAYATQRPQDTYARELGFRHTYEVPVASDAHFQWRAGYDLGAVPAIRAQKFFTVEGRLDGLGYMADKAGLLVAAPVIVADYTRGPMAGSRIVALDFTPQPGYWQSEDGITLIREAAVYAHYGATSLSVETLFATLRPNEPPTITVHLHVAHSASTAPGELKLTLQHDGAQIDSVSIPLQPGASDIAAPFNKPLPAGFYTISAAYTQSGSFRAFHQNGFWVADPTVIASGPKLAVRGDFITSDGAPFFPVGSNYFSTEANGWDFSGPRNAWVWNRDFDEMEHHGVTFVRTGVWMPYGRLVESAGGGVTERFQRNLEAFLLCAQRHHIAVNFTFFAFAPRAAEGGLRDLSAPTQPNPYLNADALRSEQAYVRSVVDRFKNVPWLSWDLINEPSFSNPRTIFHGNTPNGDADELAAWRRWLQHHYNGDLAALASAWSVPAEQLVSFDSIPLPVAADLNYDRYGNPRLVRAVDYNLFAQDMFSEWVRGMVSLIRGSGSRQLIDVGQDEGGVTDRVLNQFYGGAGVSFTTNHTYWQDDALLWDSVAAKRPGMPNITGETGYQPVWEPDGTWRYDEFTGLGLTERKWAFGFAAGSTGALQWDWDREVDFGMKRSDGSSKVWENQMRDLGEFAKQAAPFATALQLPDVAIVLPQSLQMSVHKAYALEAQQAAVRALYNDAHAAAYAVGEYQIDLLGNPKLILLPSPYGLADQAWKTILDHVKTGATLLVTGPFDGDTHMHPTGRQDAIGLTYTTVPLTIRENIVHFPWGDEAIVFAGTATTAISRAQLADGSAWAEREVGKGRILFCPLPLELSTSRSALGNAYRYALQKAGVKPIYTTASRDTGITIAPTIFPNATLYVVASESNQGEVTFTDARSGRTFSNSLAPGTAAILLVGADGKLLATYRWNSAQQ